jgi:hypothetical protein
MNDESSLHFLRPVTSLFPIKHIQNSFFLPYIPNPIQLPESRGCDDDDDEICTQFQFIEKYCPINI